MSVNKETNKETNKVAIAIVIFAILFFILYLWPSKKISNYQTLKNLHNTAQINLSICAMSQFQDPNTCPLSANNLDGGLEFINEEYLTNPDLVQEGLIEYQGDSYLNHSSEDPMKIILKLGPNHGDNAGSECIITIDGNLLKNNKKEVLGTLPDDYCQ